VEVGGCQVGTVGGMFHIQHTRTPVLELLAPSSHHLHWLHVRTPLDSTRWLWWMLAGHALFHCPVFNTALCQHCLRNEGCAYHNKWGRLPVDTEHSDTPPVLCSPWK
jgi:hypothetical protein